MKIKNLILSSVVAGSALLSAGTANSATIWGEVVLYYSDATWGYVFVKPSNVWGIPSYLWWARTNDPELGNRIPGLLHKTVYLNTTAASCAAAGAYRYCGDITSYYGY
jgi:hypothetical protein